MVMVEATSGVDVREKTVHMGIWNILAVCVICDILLVGSIVVILGISSRSNVKLLFRSWHRVCGMRSKILESGGTHPVKI